MRNDAICHLKTGGTIGGCVPEYIEVEKVSSIFSDVINYKKYIKDTFGLKNEYKEIQICRKDSRQVSDEDRSKIVSEIEKEFELGVRKFMITHGTYTMKETGEYLLGKLSKECLTSSLVIITGSMYPWAVVGSDAPMNIGAALSNLIEQDVSGVYLCMHGKRFAPDNVIKDTEGLLFKETR